MSKSTTMKALFQRTLASLSAGIGGYGLYKAKVDPPHIVWDLDETILHSVTPISDSAYVQNGNDPQRYFDQIDDDFPYDNDNTPNTRTFWRPGARLALNICRLFSHQYVFTAAQKTYTDNIMNALDNSSYLFDKILHRDMVPVQNGKDLLHVTDRLDRAILLDDRVSNFAPQHGQNGIHIPRYTGKESDVRELQQVARMVGIALMALFVTDVRTTVVPYFRSKEHQRQCLRQINNIWEE